MDKKHHKPHYDEAEENTSKYHRQLKHQIQEEDIGFDEDDDPELYLEVMRFLK